MPDHLPYTLHLGDCLLVLKTFPDNSFDSVVTDPPYGIRFMGKAGTAPTLRRAQLDGRKCRATHLMPGRTVAIVQSLRKLGSTTSPQRACLPSRPSRWNGRPIACAC